MQVVITGGCGTGKSTLLTKLQKKGFRVVEEIARPLLQQIERGLVDVPHPRVNRHAFQTALLERQLRAEKTALRSPKLSFLDRGVFDGIAYYIMDELPVPAVYDAIDSRRYNLAFVVEDVGRFENDGVRFEDLAFARRFAATVRNVYEQRGIKVITVPRMSVPRRISLILDAVAQFHGNKP